MTVQERQRTSYHGMTPELWDVRERLREFINGVVIPAEPELDSEERLGARARELKNEAKRKGLWALGHPKEIGGQGVPVSQGMPTVRVASITVGGSTKKG